MFGIQDNNQSSPSSEDNAQQHNQPAFNSDSGQTSTSSNGPPELNDSTANEVGMSSPTINPFLPTPTTNTPSSVDEPAANASPDPDSTPHFPIVADTAVTSSTNSDSGAGDDLLDIKQAALKELSPLVPHLDQTAEEKFKTTMMMLQATDNHSLVKTAYETAQQIEDEKVRAQALLDVVNEINYFTQHKTD